MIYILKNGAVVGLMCLAVGCGDGAKPTVKTPPADLPKTSDVGGGGGKNSSAAAPVNKTE